MRSRLRTNESQGHRVKGQGEIEVSHCPYWQVLWFFDERMQHANITSYTQNNENCKIMNFYELFQPILKTLKIRIVTPSISLPFAVGTGSPHLTQCYLCTQDQTGPCAFNFFARRRCVTNLERYWQTHHATGTSGTIVGICTFDTA